MTKSSSLIRLLDESLTAAIHVKAVDREEQVPLAADRLPRGGVTGVANRTASATPNNSFLDLDVPCFLGSSNTPASDVGAPPFAKARTSVSSEPEPKHSPPSAAPVTSKSRAARTKALTDITIPLAYVRKDPPGSTCILSFVHQQELEITPGTDGAVLNVISGQLDGVNWNVIHLLLAMLRQALSGAGLVDSEQLVDTTAIVLVGEKWNPAARMLVLSELDDEAIAMISSVCEAALSALTQTAEQRSNLTIVDLDSVAQDAIRKSVEDAIESSRGCNFDFPLVVQGPHGPVVQLTGRVGRKKDKTSHHPEPIGFTGRIGGFIHFGKAHYFILHPAEGAEVRIDFQRKQLRGESEPDSRTTLSLVELARMNACNALCEVRAHKTLDAQGRAVYSFVSIGQLPADSPDTANTIMTSENTATNS